MTHASTFSGIGGAEVAADMMGWENLFHCEINPFGRKILDYHYPNSKSYEDITKTDFSEWRGRVDVLTGGFPCQPFSYAGKRRGAEDDRYLWPYMLRCIEQVSPTWFVGENVAGITTMALPSETAQVAIEADLFGEGYTYEKTSERFVLDEICGNLERIGYAVQPFIIPACSVGAPHRRDRIFIVACDDSQNTMRSGLLHGHDEEQRSEWNKWNTRAGGDERICGEERTQVRTSSDTNCGGRSSRSEANGGRWEDGERIQPDSYGFSETFPSTTSNTESQPSCRPSAHGRNGAAGQEQLGGGGGQDSLQRVNLFDRWRTFPTVSPILRGDDGLPFDVDSLTISASKWRTESLKAYGNAIVPQVMYEIFRAIEYADTCD